MYKVLVVDDERVIREGIVQLIDWDILGLEVIGAKENGIEALEIIKKEKPDIVITDIMMPELNGLELISKVKSENLNVNFIVLSGYGEFDYATIAMKYGVKDYILKPCDEIEITDALKKILNEIQQKDKKDQLLSRMTDNWETALPQMKEKFLIEALEMGNYPVKDFNHYKQMFELTDLDYRLVLLRPEQDCSLLERFTLKNLSVELLSSNKLQISTISNGDILLLIGSIAYDALQNSLEDIQQVFLQNYNRKIFIAISNEAPLEELQLMYSDICDCLQYGFYIGEGHMIAKKEVNFGSKSVKRGWEKDIVKIVISIKTGHDEVVKELTEHFFIQLGKSKEKIELTKIYCMELLLNMIQHCNPRELDKYAKAVVKIEKMETLPQIEQYVTDIGVGIAKSNYEYTSRKYSAAIKKVISYIEEQLANPELSLKKVARDVLFMNEDYLGRLFHRETGERFSLYVNKLRMEKAKGLLEERAELKMVDISNLTGFADKNHYFSLAFKKYTGMSPSEYRGLFENVKSNPK